MSLKYILVQDTAPLNTLIMDQDFMHTRFKRPKLLLQIHSQSPIKNKLIDLSAKKNNSFKMRAVGPFIYANTLKFLTAAFL